MTDLERQVRNIADQLSEPEEWRKEWLEYQFSTDEERQERVLHEGEPSAYEWLEDALDWNYIISRSGDFLGAEILVAFGGPNIWVNTKEKQVDGYWGGEHFSASYIDELGIEDAMEEYYDSSR